MAPVIQILDPRAANQIAAGEVVERPVSVIKELVENALDAGARRIDIAVEGNGVPLMRVRDDGAGIDADDLPRAVLRHATSKIRAIEDLNTLTTLGFRGEALPSIASVSRLEIVSRPPAETVGYCLRLEGGAVQGLEEVGCPAGTTVTVEDLFYNTPARLKFLRSSNTEFGLISDTVGRLALARPDVSFSLAHPRHTVFQTPGRGRLLESIAAVLGANLARRLLPVSFSQGDWRLEGYISPPDLARSNRQALTFIVNGRYIRSSLLTRALQDGYHTLIPAKLYPIAILHLRLSPAEYDVNVHPTKMDVKFAHEQELAGFICEGIRKAILAVNPVPSFGWRETSAQRLFEKGSGFATGGSRATEAREIDAQAIETRAIEVLETLKSLETGVPGTGLKEPAKDTGSAESEGLKGDGFGVGSEKADFGAGSEKADFGAGSEKADFGAGSEKADFGAGSEQVGSGSEIRDLILGMQPREEASNTENEGLAADTEYDGRSAKNRTGFSDNSRKSNSAAQDEATAELWQVTSRNEAAAETSLLSDTLGIWPLAQVFGTYILATDGKVLVVIDQHAAHERINYEEFLREAKERGTKSQALLVPVPVELTLQEEQIVLEHLWALIELGFVLEHFGEQTYLLRAVPVQAAPFSGEDLLRQFIDTVLSRETAPSFDELLEEWIYLLACKASLKAKESLSLLEMEQLLNRLARTENPYTCPHGRPTMIQIRKDELERRFYRR